jgi:hypothetical protein
MFLMRCTRCRETVLVGSRRLVALDRTADGYVAYLRCHCGGLGTAEVRSRSAARSDAHRPPRRVA